MKWLALVILLLMVSPALAGTITIRGTNISNAQSNLSLDSTNASVSVTTWTVGAGTKTLAVKGYNASESLTFVLYNFTATMVIERKDNSTSKAAYQANSTGAITFTTTQNAGNITYSFTPAINQGGMNWTWGRFWTYPFIADKNLSTIITDLITGYNYLPLSGTTTDLDMNDRNITNVRRINSTTVNVTTLNATNVQGNGSGLSALNASNLTDTIPSGRYATGIYVANITDYESNISGRSFVTNTTVDKNLSNYTGVVLNASMPVAAMNFTTNWLYSTTVNVTVAKQPNNTYAITDATGSSGFTQQSNVTGSRALGTNYRNTAGKTMFVVVSAYGGSESLAVYTDASATPTTKVSKLCVDSAAILYASVSFMVLNNNYYRVQADNACVGSSTTLTLGTWTEWY